MDLLSAFHRDCKKGDEWAIQPHFRISSCVYSSAEGCRQYRTSRRHDGPPPYLHGSFKPLKDCTLHVVGLRQTLQLEGLTRGFDITAEDSLAKAVANASMLPPGAISITVAGGRRLAETGAVTLELSLISDDLGVGDAALTLSSLSTNTPFLKQAATALGETGLSLSLTGNLSAVDGSSEEAVATTTTNTVTTTTTTATTRTATTTSITTVTATTTSVTTTSVTTTSSTSVTATTTSATTTSTTGSLPQSSHDLFFQWFLDLFLTD